jgi:hypothetical protein
VARSDAWSGLHGIVNGLQVKREMLTPQLREASVSSPCLKSKNI